jgi:fatty-acyl-CoA synthase
VDEDTIKTYVRDHLARYKVPREVVFLDELPRNPTGKVLKRELREIFVGGDDEKASVGGDDEKAVGGDDEKA